MAGAGEAALRFRREDMRGILREAGRNATPGRLAARAYDAAMLESLGIGGWAVAVFVALCVGMAKTGLSGLGMVAVVLMAMILPARESTGALLTLLIAADVYAVVAFRRHAVWSQVFALLPPAFFGIVCGYFLMPQIPDEMFRHMIGWITLVLLVLLVWQRWGNPGARIAGHPALAWLAGWASGVTTMVANAAGPVMTLYLLARRMPKMEFVGTAAWFFFVVNLSKVPFSLALGLVTWESLWLTAVLIPAIIVGGFCGRWIVDRIDQRVFELLMIGFTFVGAIRLLWR